MKKHAHIMLGRVSQLIAISLFAVLLFIPKADGGSGIGGSGAGGAGGGTGQGGTGGGAQNIVNPKNIVSLTGAGAAGTPTNMIKVGSSSPYIVPPNKSLILTDIIISPQSFPPTGAFLSQVFPSPPNLFSSSLTVTSTAADASSFQVHLNTGMVFPAGSKVTFFLNFGASGVHVSAFGFTFP
jgi:hypothetical protein